MYLITDSGDLCELTQLNKAVTSRVYRSGLPEKTVYPCVMIYQLGGNRVNQLDLKPVDTSATYNVSIFDTNPAVCDQIFKELDLLYTQNNLQLIGKREVWELQMAPDRIYHIASIYRARTTTDDRAIRG